MSSIDYSSLENALSSLQESLKIKKPTDVERDGIIQRFEYTFELCWKMIRKHLIQLGRSEVSSSPKPLLRDALEENLIEDIKPWFGFLESRNLVSHTYDENKAHEVYKSAKLFPSYVAHLLKMLKK